MSGYPNLIKGTFLIICVLGFVYNATAISSSRSVYSSPGNYSWFDANTYCVLLGSGLSGGLLSNPVRVHDASDGWIAAHVKPNGFVKFGGCFFGRLPPEPGLIVSTDHILHCNHYCNGSDFMFHGDICYCMTPGYNITGESCTGRRYNDTHIVIYGTSEKLQDVCLCGYRQIAPSSYEQSQTVCITEVTHENTSVNCLNSSNLNQTINDIFNSSLTFTPVQLYINDTNTTLWNVKPAHMDFGYKVYLTGAVKRDIFAWGSDNTGNNIEESQSCVQLFTHIPVLYVNRSEYTRKKILFPVKSPCHSNHHALCVSGRIHSTMNPSTPSTKALETTLLYNKTSPSSSVSSRFDTTTNQRSTSTVNTYNPERPSQTTLSIRQTTIRTSHNYPQTLPNLIGTDNYTTRQTQVSTESSESVGSPSGSEIVTPELVSEAIHTTRDTVIDTSYHATRLPGDTETEKPFSGPSSDSRESSLVGPAIGGAAAFIVILIGCVTSIYCLKKRRHKQRSRKTRANNISIQNSKCFNENVMSDKGEMETSNNEISYSKIQESSLGCNCSDGMYDSFSDNHRREDGQDHYDHTDIGSGYGVLKKGDNCRGQSDMYDHARMSQGNSGSEYDSFQTTKGIAEKCDTNDYDTNFENGCLNKKSDSAAVDDMYDHARTYDQNDTYDSFQHHGERCPRDYGSDADYGQLQRHGNIVETGEDLYDHSRGRDNMYDSFQSGVKTEHVSDYYDYSGIGNV